MYLTGRYLAKHSNKDNVYKQTKEMLKFHNSNNLEIIYKFFPREEGEML